MFGMEKAIVAQRKITEIDIRYFQGHVHTTLNLCGGINAIIGNSSAGKSAAAIKAVEWVAKGTVAGVAPVKFGKSIHHESIHGLSKKTKKNPEGTVKIMDNTIVNIKFDDGHIIKKSKGKDPCTYLITYPESLMPFEEGVNPLPLTAPGVGVPEEVSDIFGFSKMNHANQWEGMFLVFDTPGEIARTLNEIVDMVLPDKLLSTFRADKKSTKAKRGVVTKDIKLLTQDLKEFETLDEIKESLSALAGLEDKLENGTQRIIDITATIAEFLLVSNKLNAFSNIEEQLVSLDALKKLKDALDTGGTHLDDVTSYLSDLDYVESTLKTFKDLDKEIVSLENLSNLNDDCTKDAELLASVSSYVEAIKKVENDVQNLPTDAEIASLDLVLSRSIQVDESKKMMTSIATYIASLTACERDIALLNKEVEVLTAEYESIMSTQGCPLCGHVEETIC